MGAVSRRNRGGTGAMQVSCAANNSRKLDLIGGHICNVLRQAASILGRWRIMHTQVSGAGHGFEKTWSMRRFVDNWLTASAISGGLVARLCFRDRGVRSAKRINEASAGS